MKTHSYTRIGIAITAMLAITGCGSSDDSSSTIAPSESTTAGPGENEPFMLGVEAPLSGSQADIGQGMLRGAQMAANLLNEQGGVLGRPVTIVPIDDAADPETGRSAAQAAITAGLDGVVGPYNSGVGRVTLPLYEAAGLVPLRLTSADDTAGFGITLQPMTSQIAPVTAEAIKTWLGATSVAIIFDSAPGYNADAAATTRDLLTAAGITITIEQNISAGAASYAEAIQAAIATGPELIFVVAYYPEAGLIAKELAETNSNIACLADYGAYDSAFVEVAGTEGSQRCSVVGVPAPDDFPGSANLVEAHRELFGSEPGTWAPYVYDSVLVLADAVTRAKGTDPEALMTALKETSNVIGWTGSATFDATTGNRLPAPVSVNRVDANGAFHVDPSWASASGFTVS